MPGWVQTASLCATLETICSSAAAGTVPVERAGWEAVRNFAERHFPGLPERYAWANQDCMTLDGLPYVGAFSPIRPIYMWPPGLEPGA